MNNLQTVNDKYSVPPVLSICTAISVAFFLGYWIGYDHSETIAHVAIPKQKEYPCLTAPQVKKLYYDYARKVK